jgi:hypothetical protein
MMARPCVCGVLPDGPRLPLERPGEAPALLGHDLSQAALQLAYIGTYSDTPHFCLFFHGSIQRSKKHVAPPKPHASVNYIFPPPAIRKYLPLTLAIFLYFSPFPFILFTHYH